MPALTRFSASCRPWMPTFWQPALRASPLHVAWPWRREQASLPESLYGPVWRALSPVRPSWRALHEPSPRVSLTADFAACTGLAGASDGFFAGCACAAALAFSRLRRRGLLFHSVRGLCRRVSGFARRSAFPAESCLPALPGLCAAALPGLGAAACLPRPLRGSSSSSSSTASSRRIPLLPRLRVPRPDVALGKIQAEIDLFFVAAANVVQILLLGSILCFLLFVKGSLLDLLHVALGARPLDGDLRRRSGRRMRLEKCACLLRRVKPPSISCRKTWCTMSLYVASSGVMRISCISA